MIGAAIGTAVGGIAQSRAASKGADAQADAARSSNATQRYIFDQNREDLAPYREAGGNALAALQYELGLAERPTFGGKATYETPDLSVRKIQGGTDAVDMRTRFQGFSDDNHPLNLRARENAQATRYAVGGREFDTRNAAQDYIASQRKKTGTKGGIAYQGFQATPGYEFRRSEGENALERMMAARGMRMGGAAMKEAMRFGDGLAAQEYGNFYNRLAGMAGVGQSATNTTAQLGQTYAANVGANNMAAGRAKASGYAGQANALNGTINGLGSIYGAAAGGYFGPTAQGWVR